MKKLYAFLLTLGMLFGSMVLPASAAAEATDELASNYIPADVETKLKEMLDCDSIIKIYEMYSCWQGIAENRPIQTIVEEDTTRTIYAVFNDEGHRTEAARCFFYQDDVLEEFTHASTYPSKFYKWLSETAFASYLQIDGKVLPIQNVYGISGIVHWQCPVVVYDVGDARYYAASLGGFNQPPTYFDEPSFYSYVSAWIADWNETHRLPEGIEDPLEIPAGGGVPDVCADQFNPLNVKLRKTAVPIWVLPVGIVLAGGIATVVIVRRRKRKAVSEGELSA